MLKKLLPLYVLGLVSLGLTAQTIVSTTPGNKKVVLEEYTGLHCVFCPQGHAIAQGMHDANPESVFLINVHVGGFATPASGEPDFRTPFGTALDNFAGVTGYPSGSISRTVFPGRENTPGKTAIYRNFWVQSSNETLAQASFVNVAVESTLNVQTSELTVHVEAYYTGNSTEATNKLNVALLQNNTKGPQTGGNMGNNYVHQHRLVYLLTGQWGEDITTTTAGTFVDRTYTYTIPAMYNNVPTELADMEIVAFVNQSNKDMASAGDSFPQFLGITNQNDAFLRSVAEIPNQCSPTLSPVVNIQNTGQNTITSLDINYSVNGGANATYTWTGELTSLQNANVTLPGIAYTPQGTNTVSIAIANDDDNTNNTASTTFSEAVQASGTSYMSFRTDAYGSEARYNVKDADGNTIYQGGPFPNNTTIEKTFDLPADCYTFNVIDTYGDGGGPVSLTDANGLVIYSTTGNYGAGASTNFGSDGVLGVDSNDVQAIAIYPNPANTTLNIRNAERSNVEVYDMLGKLVLTRTNIGFDEQLDVARLQTGTYVIKITQDGYSKTERFIVSR